MAASQPSGPQVQWPMIGYMNPVTPMLYRMSPMKPQRPTIAPDVIVEQVSANANWNTQNASKGTPVVPYVSATPFRKNPDVPMNPFPGSNMNAKPQAQNVTPQMHV